ncbi:carbamoyltransferase HypF [Piscinibacter sakaiensis]|uniref:Kae1-like domain-containing protein n=1 Tax=Piscinibacter sakaiensis TaxID=1547922 RepID=UPI003AAF0008
MTMRHARLALPLRAPARVLACGAFLKSRACLLEDRLVLRSAIHGDLGSPGPCIALERSVDRLCELASGPIDAIAHDLHPDFHSTAVAQALAARLGVPAIGVQHHHAHVAAVIAEQGLADPVIGIALDGVGLGSDGTAWGGEVLHVGGGHCADRWARVGHLETIALPGGDVAAREPWRVAAAVLHAAGRCGEIEPRFSSLVGALAARTVATMLDRRLNCPSTTSAGRWFDAAAGALGLSVRQGQEAEAAVLLEHRAADWLKAHRGDEPEVDAAELRQVVADLFDVDRCDPAAVGRGAATFHLALAAVLARIVVAAAGAAQVRHVVFGGGCFMNRVLSEQLTRRLRRAGLVVHAPRAIGCGDAGLALGQAWVAACQVAAGAAPARASVPLEMEV